ncbi:MAG: hypothetical protein WCJ39_05705 [bacterium]
MKKIYAILSLFMIVTTSCQKDEEETPDRTKYPSTWVQEISTTFSPADSIAEDMYEKINKLRKDFSNPPIYYSKDLTEIVSYGNIDLVDDSCFVVENDRKLKGQMEYWQITVKSLKDFYCMINDRSDFHVIYGEVYRPNNRFWNWDLFGMSMEPYPIGDCRYGSYKLKFLLWYAVPH